MNRRTAEISISRRCIQAHSSGGGVQLEYGLPGCSNGMIARVSAVCRSSDFLVLFQCHSPHSSSPTFTTHPPILSVTNLVILSFSDLISQPFTLPYVFPPSTISSSAKLAFPSPSSSFRNKSTTSRPNSHIRLRHTTLSFSRWSENCWKPCLTPFMSASVMLEHWSWPL